MSTNSGVILVALIYVKHDIPSILLPSLEFSIYILAKQYPCLNLASVNTDNVSAIFHVDADIFTRIKCFAV